MTVKHERPADARASWRSISKRWRLVVAFLVVGLLGALAYTALSPRRLVAHSLVLLPPAPADGSATPTRDMGTETRIATSSPVLEKAIKTTGGTISVDDLRQRVSASAVTPSLLEVQVEDTSSRRAITFSNAVALGYVAYSKQLASQSGDTLVQVLHGPSFGAERPAERSRSAGGRPDREGERAPARDGGSRQRKRRAERAGVPPHERDPRPPRRESGDQHRQTQRRGRNRGPSSPRARYEREGTVTARHCASVPDRGAGRARRWERGRAAGGTAATTGPVVEGTSRRPSAHPSSRHSTHDGTRSRIRVRSRTSTGARATSRPFVNSNGDWQMERMTGAGFVVVSLSGDDAAIQIVRQLSEAAAQSGLETVLFVPPSRQSLDGLHVPPTGLQGATQDNPTIHELHRTLDDAAPNADLAIVLVITDGSKLELPRWSGVDADRHERVGRVRAPRGAGDRVGDDAGGQSPVCRRDRHQPGPSGRHERVASSRRRNHSSFRRASPAWRGSRRREAPLQGRRPRRPARQRLHGRRSCPEHDRPGPHRGVDERPRRANAGRARRR